MNTEPIAWQIRPAIIVPALLTIGAASIAVTTSVWALIAIPFIALGSFCSAPNHNLADGFLAIVASIVGVIVLIFHQEIGASIFLGASISWFLSSFEKRQRAVPLYKEETPN